jgi:hypothetical protein
MLVTATIDDRERREALPYILEELNFSKQLVLQSAI